MVNLLGIVFTVLCLFILGTLASAALLMCLFLALAVWSMAIYVLIECYCNRWENVDAALIPAHVHLLKRIGRAAEKYVDFLL